MVSGLKFFLQTSVFKERCPLIIREAPIIRNVYRVSQIARFCLLLLFQEKIAENRCTCPELDFCANRILASSTVYKLVLQFTFLLKMTL